MLRIFALEKDYINRFKMFLWNILMLCWFKHSLSRINEVSSFLIAYTHEDYSNFDSGLWAWADLNSSELELFSIYSYQPFDHSELSLCQPGLPGLWHTHELLQDIHLALTPQEKKTICHMFYDSYTHLLFGFSPSQAVPSQIRSLRMVFFILSRIESYWDIFCQISAWIQQLELTWTDICSIFSLIHV